MYLHVCIYTYTYTFPFLSPYSASDSLRFRAAAEVRMAKFKAATSTSKFCAAMVASWRPQTMKKTNLSIEKKETEPRKKKVEMKINQQKTSEGMCVCAKMNVYVTPLSTPPTVTLSPSTVEILSSTAKDPSKIPESVARCHGHHEWHKRMSWASAYPNDNPSGESDASLPFWWIFFVAPKVERRSFFKGCLQKQVVFFWDPAPKERMRWIRVNTTCWHWR